LLQVGGVAFTYDPSRSINSRILDVALVGTRASGPYRLNLYRSGTLVDSALSSLAIKVRTKMLLPALVRQRS
jgi:hypothetical protein